jgi:hypothetical protein
MIHFGYLNNESVVLLLKAQKTLVSTGKVGASAWQS